MSRKEFEDLLHQGTLTVERVLEEAKGLTKRYERREVICTHLEWGVNCIEELTGMRWSKRAHLYLCETATDPKVRCLLHMYKVLDVLWYQDYLIEHFAF